MEEVIKILLFFFSTNSLESILVDNSMSYKNIELRKRYKDTYETKHRKIFSMKNNKIFEIFACSSCVNYYL